jgi:hypothetical protein
MAATGFGGLTPRAISIDDDSAKAPSQREGEKNPDILQL